MLIVENTRLGFLEFMTNPTDHPELAKDATLRVNDFGCHDLLKHQ